jgi:hypothetical protein
MHVVMPNTYKGRDTNRMELSPIKKSNIFPNVYSQVGFYRKEYMGEESQ